MFVILAFGRSGKGLMGILEFDVAEWAGWILRILLDVTIYPLRLLVDSEASMYYNIYSISYNVISNGGINE